MQISPRYDDDPVIRLDGDPTAIATPFLRQRRRMAAILDALTPEQWEAPSRCEGWRVQDVVAHLTGTDQFWNISVASGVAGAPTRFLAAFDPKGTPATMVDAVRDASPSDALATYLEVSTTFCATVESLDDDGWNATAESPAGHVSISAVLHHALWDAWIHERDVLLPLGMQQDHEPDEVLAAVRYAAALGPALATQTQPGRAGSVALEVADLDAHVAVTVDRDVLVVDGDAPADALVLRGSSVDLVEALSVRAPWQQEIPDDKAWLLEGLVAVFEAGPPPT